MIPDDLAAELPPPRDDEPESLRQDVIDELADHLHCAMQRELLTSNPAIARRLSPDATDEQSAYARVLARFGDPASLARRLWLDAMKERIMMQKLTAALAALACVLIGLLLWKSLDTNAAFRDMLAAEKARNATLLEELKAMRESSNVAANHAGWTPVIVQLKSESGEPLDGSVRISGVAINAGSENGINASKKTDESGRADFGLLPHGNYELLVSVQATNERHTELFMLSPGAPPERTVVCPDSLPSVAEVAFEIDPPEPFHEDQLLFIVALERRPRSAGTGRWTLPADSNYYALVTDADGHVLGEVVTHWADADPRPRSRTTSRGGRGSEVEALRPGTIEIGPAQVRAGEYLLAGVSACVRVPDKPPSASGTMDVFYPTEFYGVGDETFTVAVDTANVLAIDPPRSDWSALIEQFYRNDEIAFAAIPDGLELVDVPTHYRNIYSERFPPSDRTYVQTGGRVNVTALLGESEAEFVPGAGAPPEPMEIVLVRSAEVAAVPDADGPGGGFSRVAAFGSRAGRPRSASRVEIKLLVDPETARAIELAKDVGGIEAVPLPPENEQTASLDDEALETLKAFVTDSQDDPNEE